MKIPCFFFKQGVHRFRKKNFHDIPWHSRQFSKNFQTILTLNFTNLNYFPWHSMTSMGCFKWNLKLKTLPSPKFQFSRLLAMKKISFNYFKLFLTLNFANLNFFHDFHGIQRPVSRVATLVEGSVFRFFQVFNLRFPGFQNPFSRFLIVLKNGQNSHSRFFQV